MSTLFGQLKALLWRNILLKKRNKKQLIQELFYPIYFVLLLSLIKTLAKPSTTPPTPEFPQYNLADPRFILNTNRNILVVPDTPEVKDIIATVEGYIGSLNVVYSATEAEAVALYKATSNNVSAGIVFNDTGDNPVYSIRTTYNDDLLSTKLFTGKGECLKADKAATDSNCKANKYLTTGFAWLQRAIEAAFIKKKSATFSQPEVFVQMMPKEEFSSDVTYIQYLASVYFVMAYSSFVNFLTVNIVAEKEKKIREGMKMMGLRDSVLWLSWSLTYTLLIAVVTAVITVIAYGFGFYSRSSNMFIFFLLMLLYGISIITMAFAVTPFFRKAQAAGMVTSFATIAISCLYFAVSLTRETTRDGYHYPYAPGGVWAICLLSPVALALGIDQGIYLDTAKGGMTFANMSEGEFPLSGPIIMLVVDIILYAVIAVYFDHVIPGEFGPRYPPWYFLMPSYYCQKKRSGDSELSALTSNDHQSINGSFTGSNPNIEPVHQDLKDKAGVRINNISKDFPSKEETVHAVRGLSLDMYEGHITALLGHNGAGKTTLINMLCGLTPPTSGTATIYDMDVSNSGDMERLRAMCGVCPQHNILYDDLTTKEHLIVFAGIKGVAEDGKEEAVTRAMKDADIYEKADTFAKNLSGGQKRKLSVAMALIGDPKIIFLDEPTAGMDPFSRRHLWSLLQNSKKGRIILLTTHFMDEADILADRKAIISHGTLRCLGSSLFLKNRFGIGYHLNMVVEPDCNAETVSSVLSEQVKGVEMKRSHAKELAFTLPLSEVSTFSNMFSSLELKVNGTTQAEKLGIKSYGVSMTTLEEVFLKLGEDTDENPAPGRGIENPAYDENGLRSTQRVFSDSQVNIEMKDPSNPTQSLANRPTVENLTSQRFWALMKIRFLIIIRNPMAVIFQIVLPIVFVVVGCVLSTLGSSSADSSNPKPVSLFATSATYASAPLAAIDSQNNADSTTFISKVNDTWQVDKNLNISLLLYPNHILGFNLQQYQTSNNDINYTALYNTTALHSLPTIINIMSNTLYSMVTGGLNISGSSLPWPSITTQLTYSGSAFSATLVVALAFAVLSPGFAMFLVVERQTKTRGQQRVAGITFNMYWASLFILNCTMFAIPVVICIIIVGAVPVPSLSSAGAMVSLVLLFITYIPANILVVYNLSFAFDAYETCQAVLPNLMIFGTLLPYVAVSLTDMLGSADAATAIHYVMTVINPLYALIGGLYYIDRIHRVSLIARTEIEFGIYFQGDSNILITILMPIVHCGLLYVLLRVLDVRSTGGNSKEALNCQGTSKVNDIPEDNQDVIGDEDEDVAEERNRVNSLQTGAQDAPVAYVQNIRKEFAKDIKAFCKKTKQKTNVAVRNATFAVDCGEVFGLLGPNGAGKTTALNMIIAETGPTRGKVIVAGHDIRSSMSSAFQAMGYCAQHDALWEKITLREHIEFYGLLRGLSKNDSVTMADGMIASLKVEEHAKKGAKKLSGGTKRKLSYAISMLGSPEIVLLDEPSTGMDPQSKRFLWDTISGSFEGTKRGAILTTHYMEEADALCSRVAIMVNGKIECLGPTQHLKDKYGSGYLLEVKLKTGGRGEDIETRMDSLESHVVALFPQASCMERFEERGQYKIPRDNVKSLSETFSSLEQTKQTHDVEEYSFSQSTLEQVFLDFAKKQHEEGEEDNVPKSLMRQLSDGGRRQGQRQPRQRQHQCAHVNQDQWSSITS